LTASTPGKGEVKVSKEENKSPSRDILHFVLPQVKYFLFRAVYTIRCPSLGTCSQGLFPQLHT